MKGRDRRQEKGESVEAGRVWRLFPTFSSRPLSWPTAKWSRRDSNPRPSACKADALPAELRPLGRYLRIPSAGIGSTGPVDRISEVGARRVELRTSSLSATRSNQLSYAPSSTKNAQVALRRLIVDFPVQLSNGAQIELVVGTDFVLSLSAAVCRGAAGISPRPGRGVRGT